MSYEKRLQEAVDEFESALEEIADEAEEEFDEDAGEDIRLMFQQADKALAAIVKVGKDIDGGTYNNGDE